MSWCKKIQTAHTCRQRRIRRFRQLHTFCYKPGRYRAGAFLTARLSGVLLNLPSRSVLSPTIHYHLVGEENCPEQWRADFQQEMCCHLKAGQPWLLPLAITHNCCYWCFFFYADFIQYPSFSLSSKGWHFSLLSLSAMHWGKGWALFCCCCISFHGNGGGVMLITTESASYSSYWHIRVKVPSMNKDTI